MQISLLCEQMALFVQPEEEIENKNGLTRTLQLF